MIKSFNQMTTQYSLPRWREREDAHKKSIACEIAAAIDKKCQISAEGR